MANGAAEKATIKAAVNFLGNCIITAKTKIIGGRNTTTTTNRTSGIINWGEVNEILIR